MTASMLQVPGAILAWSLTDLTPAWLTDPETIVMHHGVGANRHIFDGWLPTLAGRYRILRFDMRGHGQSSRPDGEGRLDMDRLRDDLFAVMDAAGVGRAHLVGESIGGTIVLAADQSGDTSYAPAAQVQRLVVVNFGLANVTLAAAESIPSWRRWESGARWQPGRCVSLRVDGAA